MAANNFAGWAQIYDSLIIQPGNYSYPSQVKDLWIPGQKLWNEQLIDNLFQEQMAEIIKNITMSGNAAEAGGDAAQRTRAGTNGVGASSNRIQVSNTKKPLFFYVNLAKRYMQQHGEVELSALGMAIATVVTVTEILKNNGFAVETKIRTSTVEIKDEMRGRPIQKAKIEIVLAKSENFDELMATAAAEAAVGVLDGDEQN
ncbi:uncharacterized protein At2g34160-like [Lolium rigidum]|uniref:uncharacterized protein At2g34160-like n=1 Tax=Lolium rigidum TaxID=89674 RepID=UPI001F5D59DF|nr:uncharacterized protein At2g34160-like [Lolium rigidum]